MTSYFKVYTHCLFPLATRHLLSHHPLSLEICETRGHRLSPQLTKRLEELDGTILLAIAAEVLEAQLHAWVHLIFLILLSWKAVAHMFKTCDCVHNMVCLQQ